MALFGGSFQPPHGLSVVVNNTTTVRVCQSGSDRSICSYSFDPETGLLIVNAQGGYGIYFFKHDHGAYGWAGADYNLAGKSFLRAIDYKTGKIVWDHPLGENAGGAGVLTTATGLRRQSGERDGAPDKRRRNAVA